ncbi:hypothetical protein OsJ_23406 [Oryza sativa Japonica Group]|uniref:Uncharacterized protein n=1 Tax=Oryza sativa subsp. japonica TaxID=39947 RepID=B9FVY6_ORYSJ|nr:hypothetical protein OsJ_23406 [Oryza sativa Japonica Group]
MELFERARTVRLRGHHDKYLYAEEDESRVSQDRSASSPERAVVRRAGPPRPRRPPPPQPLRPLPLRLQRALPPRRHRPQGPPALPTASTPPSSGSPSATAPTPASAPATATTFPRQRAAPAVAPIRHPTTSPTATPGGSSGPSRSSKVLPESLVPAPIASDDDPAAPHYKTPSRGPSPVPTPALAPASPPRHRPASPPSYLARPPPPPPGYIEPPQGYIEPPPPEPTLARIESTESFSLPLHKVDGRAIHYHIGDDNGDIGDDQEGHSFTFNGTSLEELLERLQEETGLNDVIICSRSPINGKLMPLRLQLPPNNAAMHIVLVRESSKVAKSFP